MVERIPIFFDWETPVSTHVTLRKLPLREYLARCGDPFGVAMAVADEEPVWFTHADLLSSGVLEDVRAKLESDDYLWIAHEASFDVRIWVHKYDMPYPKHWICTREASMCAFPNHPGGHGLANLGVTLNLVSGGKLGKGSDVGRMAANELAEYCKQDVRLCRDVYRICERRIPACEWAIGEICSRVKEVELHIDHEAVGVALREFTKQADTYGAMLLEALGDDQQAAINLDETEHVRSVKPAQVKRLLLENLGFSTRTISLKKINPVTLSTADDETKTAVEAASKTNKALSHKRRVVRFKETTTLDAELNWAAASTGRKASRASGKGLNILAMPKHDKEVAKLVRSMFRLDDNFCFVRADEANVEYRVGGLLAKCAHVKGLFENDIFADPYAAFGQACTGQVITKADPQRQLFKAAVLGLEYMMGFERWVSVLLGAMTKPKPDFTMLDLQQTCESQRWQFPHGRHAKGILTKLGCDPVVVAVGYHTRRLFHEIHPEFKLLAQWLLSAATLVCQGGSQSDLDDLYENNPNAPLREHVDLRIHDGFEGYSLAVYINGWPHPAVVWRDLGIRDIPGYGPCLSFMNGMKGYRSLHLSLLIENICQAGSAIGTKAGELDLAAMGYPYIFTVHDELLPAVPATPEWVHKAKRDLLTVFGPDRDDPTPWKWAVVIHPDEINVSRSWWEVDAGKLDPRFPTNAAWWNALESHPELLERLP